jgi:hypothetical protein
MDMQNRQATGTCSIDMRHGHSAWIAAWTCLCPCIIQMLHVHAVYPSSMSLLFRDNKICSAHDNLLSYLVRKSAKVLLVR